MHLMQNALDVLSDKGIDISSEEKEAALAAILLHDIGHTPFSHSLEKFNRLQNGDNKTDDIKKFVFCKAEAGWQTSDVHFPSTGRAHGLRTDARKVLIYRVARQIDRTQSSPIPALSFNNAASF
jgi:HD superfamily phosphohydrolase